MTVPNSSRIHMLNRNRNETQHLLRPSDMIIVDVLTCAMIIVDVLTSDMIIVDVLTSDMIIVDVLTCDMIIVVLTCDMIIDDVLTCDMIIVDVLTCFTLWLWLAEAGLIVCAKNKQNKQQQQQTTNNNTRYGSRRVFDTKLLVTPFDVAADVRLIARSH